MSLFSRTTSNGASHMATRRAPPRKGITFYGCDRDETALVRESTSPQCGADSHRLAVSPSTLELIAGNRCISVGHKSRISPLLLLALRRSGVSTSRQRSAGYDHIDLQAAEKLGIAVGNVAYSPDSVADYTLCSC